MEEEQCKKRQRIQEKEKQLEDSKESLTKDEIAAKAMLEEYMYSIQKKLLRYKKKGHLQRNEIRLKEKKEKHGKKLLQKAIYRRHRIKSVSFYSEDS